MLLLDLIWGNGRKRVALTTLELPTAQGGLGTPTFRAYYFAGKLQSVIYSLAGHHLTETGLIRDQIRKGELKRILIAKDLTLSDPTLLMQIARKTLHNLGAMGIGVQWGLYHQRMGKST